MASTLNPTLPNTNAVKFVIPKGASLVRSGKPAPVYIRAQTLRGPVEGYYWLCRNELRGELLGWRLISENLDGSMGEVYDLPCDLSSCDCPCYTYRSERGPCKHISGLKALLNKFNLN